MQVRWRAAGALIVLGIACYAAQTTTPSLPEFEVASVKPSKSRTVGLFVYPGGRVVASACPLNYLIMQAFYLQDFQIKGGPRWIYEDSFDIEARPPASSPASTLQPSNPKLPPSAEERKMLQALLVDRFGLQFHWDKTTREVYGLKLSGKELKLQVSTHADAFPWAGGTGGATPDAAGLHGVNISMPQLAERLSDWLHTPVTDQTKLRGSFDFAVETGKGDFNSGEDITASILAALQHLGLTLKGQKGDVPILVVDHVKSPSGN